MKVIYPGRTNDDRGPDFRDAVIVTSAALLQGDIELHAKASDWRAHHHHLDAHYNRVILHVVHNVDKNSPTRLQNGKVVPTLALNNLTKYPHETVTGAPSSIVAPKTAHGNPCHYLNPNLLKPFLDKAGGNRFMSKTVKLQNELESKDPGQVLYQEMMRALGYSKNQAPFLKLSLNLPLSKLEDLLKEKMTDTEHLARQQALFFGGAGLLPSQHRERQDATTPEDTWLQKLEKLWATCQTTETIPPDEWNFFKLRPNNSPARRLAGMSYLLLRYRRQGILKGIIESVKEAPPDTPHLNMQEAIQVATGGYWAYHINAGTGTRSAIPALIGNQRASEITVNVLLPFAFAWGRSTRRPELTRKAQSIYSRHPRLPMNSLEKHMRLQWDINSYLINSAIRQQGLIHIYRTFCSQGKCRDCPLIRSKAAVTYWAHGSARQRPRK
ncbi:DUF2851 family protein [Chloroflexota bacterium]